MMECLKILKKLSKSEFSFSKIDTPPRTSASAGDAPKGSFVMIIDLQVLPKRFYEFL